MSGHVQGKGPFDARLVVVAEAPGKWEEQYGEPLVGPSGKIWESWLRAVGLDRRDIRIENVCEFRPPGNDASAWDRGTWEEWMEDLHVRMARLEDPWLVVPMGNYALYALTGKGKVPWHSRDGRAVRPGILSWRGSILSYRDRRGREVKCLPTPHPASTFRQPELEGICRRDWERIAEEVRFRELYLPRRTHVISPTVEEVEKFVGEVQGLPEGSVVAVDIENPPVKKGGPWPIVCVGFSYHPEFSLTIPTTRAYWKDDDLLKRAWEAIRILCEGPTEKAAHNWFHEAYWLWEDQQIELKHAYWDTMYMSHALDPSGPHGLDDCASLHTRQPYWKSMARDKTGKGLFTSDTATFHTYNGIDVCVGRELQASYYQALLDQERETNEGPVNGLDFYLTHYWDNFDPLMRIMRHGVRVNEQVRGEQYTKLRARVEGIRGELKSLVGHDLYAKKSISTAKLKKWFYEDLKLPEQVRKRKPGVKTVTVDEVAVRTLMLKHPEILKAPGELILEHRRVDTLSNFYQPSRVDGDGRFRSSYGLNTEAGRLQSKASPNGTGSNAQNVDRDARDMFLADEGRIGVEVDLSQAEARIVYLLIYHLTRNEKYLRSARLRPDEFDQHTENAALIFGKPQEEITKSERYLGKKTVHGAQRDLHGKKFSEELLKDGYVRTEQECQKMIDTYHRRVPELSGAYFPWIRRQINDYRMLENSWGHRLYFTYDRLNDDTYRRGYSYHPQSEVGIHMNQRGLIPMSRHLAHGNLGLLNVHCHDSLFMSLEPEVAFEATLFLVNSLEAPRRYCGVDFSMPCEVKMGLSWKASVEWKRMPDRKTFESAMREVLSAR